MASRSASTSTEPCTSALRMTCSSLTPAVLSCSARPSSDTRELLASAASRAFCSRYSEMPRAFSRSATTTNWSPACGRPSSPSSSTGVEGGASSSALPRSSNMARTLPKMLPTTKLSPMRSVPFCDQHGGHAAAAAVELGLHHRAGGGALGIGLQLLQVGDQADHLHQQIQVLLLLGGDVHENRGAAPVFRHQAAVGQLLLDALGQGVGLIDLVDRHDDRHFGGLGVVDGLQRLRHDAVIGGDHQHDDVGDLGAAGAHAGEGLVAGRVEEHDLAAIGRRVGVR